MQVFISPRLFLCVYYYLYGDSIRMVQHALNNVNNYSNANIYSYLETSGGQSSTLYLNVVHFFNTSVNQTSVAA